MESNVDLYVNSVEAILKCRENNKLIIIGATTAATDVLKEFERIGKSLVGLLLSIKLSEWDPLISRAEYLNSLSKTDSRNHKHFADSYSQTDISSYKYAQERHNKFENIATTVSQPLAAYRNLCSQAWFDATKAQEDGVDCHSEDEQLQFLCEVLMQHEGCNNNDRNGESVIVKSLHSRIQELERESDRLEKDIMDYKAHIADVTNRLSQEMSDKVSSDETNLENIAIVNRPLNIAAEYSNLCTQAWLEAKQALDGMDDRLGCRSEDEKVKFLCEVMMISEDLALKVFHKFETRLSHLVTQPVGCLMQPHNETVYKKTSLDDLTLPNAAISAITNQMRTTADIISVEGLVQTIQQQLAVNNRSICDVPAIKTYIDQCARLAWKMVIQKPQMSLDNKTGLGATYNAEIQDAHFTSVDPTGENRHVRYYVHPMLKHSGTVLVKGKVMVK